MVQTSANGKQQNIVDLLLAIPSLIRSTSEMEAKRRLIKTQLMTAAKSLDELFSGMLMHGKRFSKPCVSKKLSCVSGLSLVYHGNVKDVNQRHETGE